MARVLRFSVLSAMCLLATARVLAQDTNLIGERVTSTNAIVGMASACGAPANDVNKATDLIAARLAEQQPYLAQRFNRVWFGQEIAQLTASFRSSGAQSGSHFGRPCSFWRNGLNILINSSGSVINFAEAAAPQAPSSAEPNQTLMTDAEIRQSLQTAMNRLPRGKLRQFVGCWSAPVEGWTMRLCFTRGGDGSTLELRDGTGTTCQMTDGAARKRSDGAFFYAFAPSGACSNKQSIARAEGYCDDLSGEFNCIVSIYQTSNRLFQLRPKSTEHPANGTFVFHRVAPR